MTWSARNRRCSVFLTWATPLAEHHPGGGRIDGFRLIHESRWAEALEKKAGFIQRIRLDLCHQPRLPPLSVSPPSRLIFFLPYCRLSWQYWTQFPWRKAEPEPLCHFIHWDDTVVKKKTILTPHLVGWNNEKILCVLLGVGCNTNTPQYPRQQLWYKRLKCSWEQAKRHNATSKQNTFFDLEGNFQCCVPTDVTCRLFCCKCKKKP